MEDRIEDALTSELTRGDFLKRAAVAGAGLTVLSGVRVTKSSGQAPPPRLSVDLAARHPRRHGRLRPMGADQDGLLHEARHRREADRRPHRRRARVHEVRCAGPGGHGLPVARRAHRVDRQRHRRQVGLGHDLGPGLRLRAADEQHDRERQGAVGQEDRARQRRVEHDRRPDPRRGGRRPEVGHVRQRRQPVGAVDRERPGRRRARLGRSARAVGRPGPEAEVPDRHRLLEAAVERLLGAGVRPATRPRSTSTRASCREW